MDDAVSRTPRVVRCVRRMARGTAFLNSSPPVEVLSVEPHVACMRTALQQCVAADREYCGVVGTVSPTPFAPKSKYSGRCVANDRKTPEDRASPLTSHTRPAAGAFTSRLAPVAGAGGLGQAPASTRRDRDPPVCPGQRGWARHAALVRRAPWQRHIGRVFDQHGSSAQTLEQGPPARRLATRTRAATAAAPPPDAPDRVRQQRVAQAAGVCCPGFRQRSRQAMAVGSGSGVDLAWRRLQVRHLACI